MRPGDRRERAVAVHEAAHLAMGYWNKFRYREVRIKRQGNITRGIGTIEIPAFPKNWRTDPNAQLDLKVHFYKCLMIYSAGYLAEFMFAGEKDFWKVNSDILKETEKTDLQVIREVADIIPQKEFQNILNVTHDWLAKPDHWGIILDIGQLLLKYKVIKGFPGVLVNDEALPQEPEHDPEPLIEFITDGIYIERTNNYESNKREKTIEM